MDVLTRRRVASILGVRSRDSNKGDNGRGLLIAGSPGFSGAALFSAAAALRAGIGTLKVFCPAEVCDALYALPEAMVVPCGAGGWKAVDYTALDALIEASTCIAIGPGMGKGEGAFELLEHVLKSAKLPIVIDADGLNALAAAESIPALLHERAVLTPHFGEMARLCRRTIAEVKADQEGVALGMAAEWGATILLKGPNSVIAAPDGRVALNVTGNAGLAKGGSGDVLTGITLAMLGQGIEPFEAACAGAYLLGASADEALALLAERFLMARDVVDAIRLTLDGHFV